MFLQRLQRKKEKMLRSIYSAFGYDYAAGLRVYPVQMLALGDPSASWHIPTDSLPKGSICYCVGAGEDVSFDIALGERGCDVYTFDPTPKAIQYVRSLGKEKFTFLPYGIWSKNETQRFYSPQNPNHVSHSILNIQKTSDYFDAQCKTLRAVMDELGHDHIDLLKLDIEGAEYEVLYSMLRDAIYPEVVCVEFDELHSPIDTKYRMRIRKCCNALAKAGYRLVQVTHEGNFTFVRNKNI